MSAAMFDAIDRNHDGVITRTELAGAMGGFMGGQPAPATAFISAPAPITYMQQAQPAVGIPQRNL